MNIPIGAKFEKAAPYNQSEQSPPEEQCMYCGQLIDAWHKDFKNRIICLDCVQDELENDINFYFK